jgi:hypothetical protein
MAPKMTHAETVTATAIMMMSIELSLFVEPMDSAAEALPAMPRGKNGGEGAGRAGSSIQASLGRCIFSMGKPTARDNSVAENAASVSKATSPMDDEGTTIVALTMRLADSMVSRMSEASTPSS